MSTEVNTPAHQDIPQYVHNQAGILAEGYRKRSDGAGIGVLACAVAVVDADVGSGRRFATEQAELVGAEGMEPYDKADIWKYLAWYGDEQAQDTVWELIGNTIDGVRRIRDEKGAFDVSAGRLAEETAERAYWLVQQGDKRPESFERARDAAKLAAETERTTRFFEFLYKLGDEESFNEELSVFDAAILRATDETISSIHFRHDSTLAALAVEAVAHDKFDHADRVLERLADDHSKALVFAALLGKGRTEGLPFIEEYLGGKEWRGGWTPQITYALAEAGYEPAIIRLRETNRGTVGGEEERLYAMVDMGVEGAREKLISFLTTHEITEHWLYDQFQKLSSHGLEAEALQMAVTRYQQNPTDILAFWIWQQAKTPPDLTMWQRAYAGAKEQRNSDSTAPARALYRLAQLATRETTVV